MQAPCVATVASRPWRSGGRKAAISGPVAPTNIVRKELRAPTSAKRSGGSVRGAGFGAQTLHRMNSASASESQRAGTSTTSRLPSATPTRLPGRNHRNSGRITSPRMIQAREAFAPLCSTACTGIAIAGAITVSSTASRMTPPPSPNAAVTAAVVVLVPTRASAAKGPMPSGSSEASSIVGGGVLSGRGEVA